MLVVMSNMIQKGFFETSYLGSVSLSFKAPTVGNSMRSDSQDGFGPRYIDR